MHVFCADDAWADGYVFARSPKNAGGRRDLTRARSRASEPAAAAAGRKEARGSNFAVCASGVWAIYLETMNLKGVSSMKIHRDLGITQKTAWHLQHRIRTAFLAGVRIVHRARSKWTRHISGALRRTISKAKKANPGRGAVSEYVNGMAHTNGIEANLGSRSHFTSDSPTLSADA